LSAFIGFSPFSMSCRPISAISNPSSIWVAICKERYLRDDDVSRALMISKPAPKHRHLGRAERPFIMGSIKSLVELYRIGWLLCLLAGESFFEINQGLSPIHLHKSSAG
jgi:hypothetical protein